MFGNHRFLALFVLTATVSIGWSYTQQGVSRTFPHGDDNFFTSTQNPTAAKPKLSTHAPLHLHQHPQHNGTTSSKSGGLLGLGSSSVQTKAASNARGYSGGGGGGGGYGWMDNGGGWSPSYGGGGGFDLLTLFGMLLALGLLAMFFSFLFNRNQNTGTTVIINATGRRRRAIEDYGDGLEGESLPELMTRLSKYFTSWARGDVDTQNVVPFKLY